MIPGTSHIVEALVKNDTILANNISNGYFISSTNRNMPVIYVRSTNNPQAVIRKIISTGVMTVNFNEAMHIPANYTDFNGTQLLLKILPGPYSDS